MSPDALIIDAVRTPRVRRNGGLSSVHSVDLLTYPLAALVARQNLSPETIEDVTVGCVTQTIEQGWCVARRAILAAGWPESIPGNTVNRLCGSGSQAVHNAAHAIRSGGTGLTIAAGVEHMTRCPMFSDATGEESPLLMLHRPDLAPQGISAERMCERFHLSREDLDAYAFQSQMRAIAALKSGRFKGSIVPVPVNANGAQVSINEDDAPRPDTSLEKLRGLKPAFQEGGKITAGNSSAIVDGAAAMLLASEASARELGLRARAKILATASIGSDPYLMLTGPGPASAKALSQAGLSKDDVAVWEINEAFAPVVLVACRELGIDPEIVNVNGGGISLGHPLGATGIMLIATALDELERTDGEIALVTLCIGLGMGIATVIQRV